MVQNIQREFQRAKNLGKHQASSNGHRRTKSFKESGPKSFGEQRASKRKELQSCQRASENQKASKSQSLRRAKSSERITSKSCKKQDASVCSPFGSTPRLHIFAFVLMLLVFGLRCSNSRVLALRLQASFNFRLALPFGLQAPSPNIRLALPFGLQAPSGLSACTTLWHSACIATSGALWTFGTAYGYCIRLDYPLVKSGTAYGHHIRAHYIHMLILTYPYRGVRRGPFTFYISLPGGSPGTSATSFLGHAWP